ncbi:ergothioneine biosynthesis glutamate--cysteine ligase EgtA [Allorhizocola rhizosphaerae]|uniref:ergothioneine biosynthesis glutamate--cysteine ligase EgtA n=1 Tax=Allorhizocola rhizosphaerae TaxID=1872709 RepID=UPI000E3B6313|nr:ergothioneine biosynthesis glutamate--cysteine ligase EgtA [Allorhizocola rhizosphaerae]
MGVDSGSAIADRAAAEGYVGKVCFKTGPPERVGVELEWTVHHRADPCRPLDVRELAIALGPHAPPTLDPASAHRPLPGGSLVTLEPGGQVELSSPPVTSLAGLIDDTAADVTVLSRLLASSGLCLGGQGHDPHRPAERLIHTQRYAAMEHAFDRVGPWGRAMMCGTAGLQVCLDIGTGARAAARWRAAHALGPPMIALFANSARDGWASGRMRTWYETDPVRTLPPVLDGDPVGAWAKRVLDTPLLCLRRDSGEWDPPPGVTFGGWIEGALPTRPTYDDLDYHMTTMFPPVRPRGYLELRYIDAQPGGDWVLPVAMITALFAREETVDAATELAEPAGQRWVQAARDGLADPVIASVVPRLVELACVALDDTDLPADMKADVAKRLSSREGLR